MDVFNPSLQAGHQLAMPLIKAIPRSLLEPGTKCDARVMAGRDRFLSEPVSGHMIIMLCKKGSCAGLCGPKAMGVGLSRLGPNVHA